MSIVSVIIPVYNVEKYIERTIDSCLVQTLREIEIIIVNDGSPDNSMAIINKKAAEDIRIIAIQKENGGVTSARNAGLSVATGKYIFFLDGDDYIEFEALEQLVKIAEENEADYVFGNFIIEFEDASKNYKILFPSFKSIDNISFLKYCFDNTYFYITGCLISKEVIQKAKLDIPKEITFGEDNLFLTQIGFNIRLASYYNGLILHYTQRKDSVTNNVSNNDLAQRAKACMLTMDYAMSLGFYAQIKSSVDYFISKEQADFIVFGFWNEKLSAYRKPSVLFKPDLLKKLGIRKTIILFGIFISPTITISLYNLFRKFARLLNEDNKIFLSPTEPKC